MILILALSFTSVFPTLTSPAHGFTCPTKGGTNKIEGCVVNYDSGNPVAGLNVYVLACNAYTEWLAVTDSNGYFSFAPALGNGSPCILTNWGFVVTVNGVISNLGTTPDDVTWSQWAGDAYTDGNGYASLLIPDSKAIVVNVITSELYSNTRFASLGFSRTQGQTVTQTVGVSASINSGASVTAGFEQSISQTFTSTNGFSVDPGYQAYFAQPSYMIGYYCGGTQQQSFGYYWGFSCTSAGGGYQGLAKAGVSQATGAAYTITTVPETMSVPSSAITCAFNVPQGSHQLIGTSQASSTSTTFSLSASTPSFFGSSVTLSYSASTSWTVEDSTAVTLGSTDGQWLNFAFYPASGPCSNLTFGSELHVWQTGAQPDFTMSANPSSLTIAAGSTGTTAISMTGLNGFNEQVSVTYMAPTGISASPNPENVFVSSTTGTANPVISVGSAVGCGASYNVYFLATSSAIPTIRHLIRVIVHVVPASYGDFCFSSNQNTSVVSGNPGATGSSCPILSFTATSSMTISLSATVPSGITASFGQSTISVNPGATTTTYVCYGLPSGSTITIGTYQSTITGTSGGIVHSTPMSIQYIGDFQLGLSSSQVYVSPGGAGSLSLTATSYDGFSGWIYLSSSNPGFGLSVSMPYDMLLQASYGWSSTSLTVYASGYTPVGSYTMTIQGIYYAANMIPVMRSTSFTVYVQSGSCGCGGGGGGGPPRPM